MTDLAISKINLNAPQKYSIEKKEAEVPKENGSPNEVKSKRNMIIGSSVALAAAAIAGIMIYKKRNPKVAEKAVENVTNEAEKVVEKFIGDNKFLTSEGKIVRHHSEAEYIAAMRDAKIAEVNMSDITPAKQIRARKNTYLGGNKKQLPNGKMVKAQSGAECIVAKRDAKIAEVNINDIIPAKQIRARKNTYLGDNKIQLSNGKIVKAYNEAEYIAARRDAKIAEVNINDIIPAKQIRARKNPYLGDNKVQLSNGRIVKAYSEAEYIAANREAAEAK